MTMKVRVLFVAAVLAATMWLAGCGHYVCENGATFGASSCSASSPGLGGGPGSGNNGQQALRYAMDSSAGGLNLEGLNINNSGTFAVVPSFVSPSLPMSPIALGGMAIVNKKFFYLAFSNGQLFAFSINQTNGTLTPIGTSPYTALGGSSIAADPLGRFIFVGDPSGISVYAINTLDGSLGGGAVSHISSSQPVQLVTDGLGKYLYGIDGSSINAFTYNASGTLTSLGAFAAGMGMQNIAGESTGKFILGVTALTGASGSTDANIYVFAITQSGTTAGALTEVTNSPFATLSPPIQVVVSPNGKFVYAMTETADVVATFDPIEGYSLDASGNLTALASSPFTNFVGQVGMFDQSGLYLFIAGQNRPGGVFSSVPLSADPSTGTLSSNVAVAGIVSAQFVVTDEP